MTTCPKCDEIRVCKRDNIFRSRWHISCDCGWAYEHSSWFPSKREAKESWEKYMNLREQATRRETAM